MAGLDGELVVLPGLVVRSLGVRMESGTGWCAAWGCGRIGAGEAGRLGRPGGIGWGNWGKWGNSGKRLTRSLGVAGGGQKWIDGTREYFDCATASSREERPEPIRPGPLAGGYAPAAAMVVLFLVPYLGLSSALQPLTPIIAALHTSLQTMSLAYGLANAGYAVGTDPGGAARPASAATPADWWSTRPCW